MSDELPPSEPITYAGEDPYGTHGRRRTISWIAGIIGLVVLVLAAVLLARHSQDSGGQGGPGAGRGRGGAGGAAGAGRGGGRGGRGNQLTTVGTAKAMTADLPVITEALGTVTPASTVTIIPQVSGTITQLLYKEGQLVHKGQTLAIIDPRPYRAALLQAQGNLQRDKAQLENARVQLQRYDLLLSQDSIARQDRDTQAALVHQLQGTVMTDQGAVQAAQINVGYTKVVSPVAGRVGLKVVDLGNYVGAGVSTGIAVVTTLQPIDVEFAIPQDQAPAIAKRVAQGAEIPAVALDRTRTQTLDTGRFSTLDNRVDTTTGTIKGKARFANSGFQLYPSQFVNIRLTVDTVHNAVVVPPSAIRSGPDGNFVWILRPDRSVTERKIKLGVNGNEQVQVSEGLQVGETVVTDGGDRLSEGAKVALPGDKPAAGGWGGGAAGGRHHRGASGGEASGGDGGGNSAAPAPAAAPSAPAPATPGASPAATSPAAGGHQGGGFPKPPEGLTPEQRHAWFQQQMQNMTPEQREAFKARRRQMREQQGGSGDQSNGQGG